jgi:hypothetical protein
MESLRKLLAITLLAFLGLPFASSLLALTPKDDANVPACCRRNGKHHCMGMAINGKMTSDAAAFSAPSDKCPFAPAALPGSLHPTSSDIPPAQITFAGLLSHPAATAQTESKWRISRERSRQKRGPPSLFI